MCRRESSSLPSRLVPGWAGSRPCALPAAHTRADFFGCAFGDPELEAMIPGGPSQLGHFVMLRASGTGRTPEIRAGCAQGCSAQPQPRTERIRGPTAPSGAPLRPASLFGGSPDIHRGTQHLPVHPVPPRAPPNSTHTASPQGAQHSPVAPCTFPVPPSTFPVPPAPSQSPPAQCQLPVGWGSVPCSPGCPRFGSRGVVAPR